MKKLQIFAGLISFSWFIALCAVLGGATPGLEIPTVIIMTATFLAYIAYAIHGPFKFAPYAGKILIAASFVALLVQLISGDPSLLSFDTFIRILTLVSGLVYERIVPHKQLQSWMFLMIATKVEAVLVGSLISGAPTEGFVPLQYWWVLVAMMLLGVPLLANGLRIPFRIATMSLSLLALVLAVDFIAAQEALNISSALAMSAIAWPLFVERLLGYKVFMEKS